MLLILTDKSKKIGSGNFYRSMNLYKNLLRHGHKVRFIKDSNFFLSNNSSKNIIKKSKIIIIDTSLISKKNYYKLHQSNVKILCFDFFFNLPHNYNISIYEHQKIYCKNHKFIGNKYINIRSGFINLKKRKIKNKSVLISIGSGDLKNKGLKVYNYLKSKNLNVDIIKGEFSNYSNFKS